MTYEGTGVSYADMDPFKLAAQSAASETAGNILGPTKNKYREYPASRGESVFLIEGPEGFLAHVEEGLGTKNLIADDLVTALKGRSPEYDGSTACQPRKGRARHAV